MILTLNRKTHRAFNRVRESSFALDGLVGNELNQQTIGIIGCGQIGSRVAQIAHGFGMDVMLVDPNPNPDLEQFGDYTDFEATLQESDILTLHCPLNDKTFQMVDADALEQMKPAALLVNTNRGALLETEAVIDRLQSNRLGALAIDVFEEESDLFFRDRSATVLQKDVFSRLIAFPNVLITNHQGFLTEDSLSKIAQNTVANMMTLAKDEQFDSNTESPLETAVQK